MTPRIRGGYISNELRDQAAEMVNDAQIDLQEIVGRIRTDPETLVSMMEVSVLLLNALRLLERDGAPTVPASAQLSVIPDEEPDIDEEARRR